LKFQDKIKGHMSAYKINQLGVFEMGLWKKNNQPYPHIFSNQSSTGTLTSIFNYNPTNRYFSKLNTQKMDLEKSLTA
jgi:hypothetical protein